jgi:hypothetical protein
MFNLLQYSKTIEMHFLYSVYCGLTSCTCFEHYLLILRRSFTNNNWHITCVLSLLVATWIGVEFHSNPGSNQQTQHASNIPIVGRRAPPEDQQVVLENFSVVDP